MYYRQAPIIGTPTVISLYICYTLDLGWYEPKYLKSR